jgi:2-phosphoglycerate kinase
MGLPLLFIKADKKKENAAEKSLREMKEQLRSQVTYDHVYWFQQHSSFHDMKMAESEKPEVDAVDQDELDELEREILGLERSGSDSDDSSSCDSDNKKKKSSLVVKKKGMATTACIMCKYNVV